MGLLDLFFSARVPASNWILGTALIIVFFLISLVMIMDHPDPWACPSLRQRLWASSKDLCRSYSQPYISQASKWSATWKAKRASGSSDDSTTADPTTELQPETDVSSPSSRRLAFRKTSGPLFVRCVPFHPFQYDLTFVSVPAPPSSLQVPPARSETLTAHPGYTVD